MKEFYHFRFLRHQVITNLLILFFLPVLLCSQAPTILWDKTIGGNLLDGLSSLQKTSDGGYILGGWSLSNISGDKTENCKGDYDYWVIKLDAAGNKVWDKTIGGNDADELKSVQETSDGGYVLGGWSRSNISGDKTENSKGYSDYWIVKLDAAGNKVWDKTIGGNGSDVFASLDRSSGGGYILGGTSYSDISGDKTEKRKGFADYWVVKLDAAGNKVWDKTIGGLDVDELSIIKSIGGGYILGGTSLSNFSDYAGLPSDKTENSKGGFDYWVVKLDAAGNKVWDKTIGGSGNEGVEAFVTEGGVFYTSNIKTLSIHPTADGGYILGGHSDSNISGDKTENSKGGFDYWVVKLDANGNKVWDKTVGGSDEDELYSIQPTADGGYILGGLSRSNFSGDKSENSKGGRDYWVVKLDVAGNKNWDKTIGGSGADELRSLQPTEDGGYILGGSSSSYISADKLENPKGIYDYWLVKLGEVILSCPSDLIVNLETNKCYKEVYNIHPIIRPNSSVDLTKVNYKLVKDGLVIEEGTGSAAGKQFNAGITTVVYSWAYDPSKTCFFTVEVKDEAPVVVCPSDINLCYNAGGNYSIPSITATDNCGIASVEYKIKTKVCYPKACLWEEQRSGTGTDASGPFLPGESVIEWTVTDVNGNVSTCETRVYIPLFLVRIADVPPLTSSGSAANTIYLGYGPNSITFEATAAGGSPGYTYNWYSPYNNIIVEGTIYPNKKKAVASDAGTYTLIVTAVDEKGCETSYTKTYYVVDVRCTPTKKFNNNIPIIPYVYMCHSGKTICVGINGVMDHLSHGDYLGQCVNTAAAAEEIITQTARNPISNETEIITQGIKLLPNPASNYLNIEWSAKTSVPTSINIIDIQGRVLKKVQAGLIQKDAINRRRISLEGLAKGNYILELRTGADIQVSKFVIQ